MPDEIVTFTRRGGEVVLGRRDPKTLVIHPRQYVNRSQAWEAAQKVNGIVIQRGRPFYVLMPK